VRAPEQYLVLEFAFNLNQGCSGVGTAFPHLLFQRCTPAYHQVAMVSVNQNTLDRSFR